MVKQDARSNEIANLNTMSKVEAFNEDDKRSCKNQKSNLANQNDNNAHMNHHCYVNETFLSASFSKMDDKEK